MWAFLSAPRTSGQTLAWTCSCKLCFITIHIVILTFLYSSNLSGLTLMIWHILFPSSVLGSWGIVGVVVLMALMKTLGYKAERDLNISLIRYAFVRWAQAIPHNTIRRYKEKVWTDPHRPDGFSFSRTCKRRCPAIEKWWVWIADCRSAEAIRVLMVGSDGYSPLGSHL